MHGIKIKARVPTSPTHLWPHGWGFKGSEVNAYSSVGPHSQKKDFFLKKKKKKNNNPCVYKYQILDGIFRTDPNC